MCEWLQPYVSQVATALLQLDRELTVSILYANQSPEDILCQAPPVALSSARNCLCQALPVGP